MSLAEQSQQWYPTSVQVTVLQARNLRPKGKNGTNDAYAIMQVAKDKFSTSVVEKSLAPEWREEATFDLPLLHQANTERSTLYIIVMHRALVGLDKLLGQAVINLLELHDNKSRKKTDWYKLVDKSGKTDKERGEVLVDIQFMRNNMTASMFDLSMQDKPRSRISKLKDKVRGKKKDGLSDSASAIVPSTVGQVLTDSDGEGESNQSPSTKKKSKLKSLFAPKTNLQRGVSQSMSTLGTLPEKNSSLSGSRSSGLNVESTEGKSKFKFLGHKRNGSTDSKVSLGPFSLLGHSKQNIPEQNNLCINGSHVYAEEQETKPNSGSSLSLSSSAKGSIEDLRRYHERNASDVSADSFKGLSIPTYKPEPMERTLHVPQRPQEDEEEKHKKSEGRLQELLERQEEQDKKRQQEREEKRRKQEEEERKKVEEREKKRQEEEEQQRKKREEEAKKAEEQKKQEELRVTERLSSLFGLGKKKEEPSPPAAESPKDPFEEIPLSPDNSEVYPPQKEVRTTFTPAPPSSAFPGRTAKVSAVKPRLTLGEKPETDNHNPLASPVTSDIQNASPASTVSAPKPSPSSEPFENFDMFSTLHSSLAPPKPQRIFAESPEGSMENLSGVEHGTSISETKRRAVLPPTYPGPSSRNENHPPKNEQHSSNDQQAQRPSLPLPDYNALFPRKRHGVMTNTRWEHIIAEVNQRKMDSLLPHSGEEMSVDAPTEPVHKQPAVLEERSSSSFNQHHAPQTEEKRLPKQAVIPPKPTVSATAERTRQSEVNFEQVHTPEPLYATVNKTNRFAAKVLETGRRESLQSLQGPQVTKKPNVTATLNQTSEPKEKLTPVTRVPKRSDSSESSTDDKTTSIPPARPRQRPQSKELALQVQPESSTTGTLKTLPQKAQEESKNKGSMAHMISLEEKMNIPLNMSDIPDGAKPVALQKESFTAQVSSTPKDQFTSSDPFPNKLISQDPWALPQQFSGGAKTKKPEANTPTPDVFDDMFGSITSKNEMDPFFGSAASNRENDPFFGSVKSKNKEDQLFESVPFKNEMDPFFGSVAPKIGNDPFFGSVPSTTKTDALFESPAKNEAGSIASKQEKQTKPSLSTSSPSSQITQSLKKKQAPQPPTQLEKTVKEKKDRPVSQFSQDSEDVEITVTSVAAPNWSKSTTVTSKTDPWAMDPFASPSQMSASSATPEVQPGGRRTLQAWVSPSEVHSPTSPGGGGGGGGGGLLTPRRPHPVKPMSSNETQLASSTSLGKDLKTPTILEVAEKSKTAESGPYTQLTQEELITLVVKQQAELSKKDVKILELEDYIDNLLVRVIEEKPSILLTLNSKG